MPLAPVQVQKTMYTSMLLTIKRNNIVYNEILQKNIETLKNTSKTIFTGNVKQDSYVKFIYQRYCLYIKSENIIYLHA